MYLMSYLLSNDVLFHPSLFNKLRTIAEIGLTLPCSNAWPEWGASISKLTKTKSRNRLRNETLNALMQTSINGPTDSLKTQEMVSDAVKLWLKTKPRKKLKTQKFTVSMQGKAVSTAVSHPDSEPMVVDNQPVAVF